MDTCIYIRLGQVLVSHELWRIQGCRQLEAPSCWMLEFPRTIHWESATLCAFLLGLCSYTATPKVGAWWILWYVSVDFRGPMAFQAFQHRWRPRNPGSTGFRSIWVTSFWQCSRPNAINLPIGYDFYNAFMVVLWTVYHWMNPVSSPVTHRQHAASCKL